MDNSTFHAPVKRCDCDRLIEQVECFKKLPLLAQGFNATNSMILVLNTYRQAVFANKAFLQMVQMNDIVDVVGKRPGEIIQCVNAGDESNGCGTSEACRYCNGMNTILAAISTNGEQSGDFSSTNMMAGYEKNINLSIHVAPLKVEQEMFYVVTFTNNGDSVGKRILEQVFFHDIINTTGALRGILGLLKDDVPDVIKPEMEFVEKTFAYLVEEIQAQKYIMDAENNQLALELTTVESTEVLKAVSKLYEGHDIAVNKTIRVDEHCIAVMIHTDYRLLRRVLGNMIKNALEASDAEGIVTLGCREEGKYITFWVHNDSYMEERVRSLVFHRSFSTKGGGRGLGTYSMKLFGENFLQGLVGYRTDQAQGTTFYIKIPLQYAVIDQK